MFSLVVHIVVTFESHLYPNTVFSCCFFVVKLTVPITDIIAAQFCILTGFPFLLGHRNESLECMTSSEGLFSLDMMHL